MGRTRKRSAATRKAVAPLVLRRLLRLALLGALVALPLAVVAFFATVVIIERGQPEIISFNDYRAQARQMSRVYAADGSPVAEWFEERRSVVCPRTLPRHVLEAVLAAEDSDFYRHPGIDMFGIARAMLVNLRAGRIRQGGSTITQQVAKTFFLTPERTYGRKLEELVLARRLEQRLTKDEILGLYLNQIYFGHGRYGIEEAAQFFFARPARDLTPEQAATLAAVIPAPVALSPVRHPPRARARRDAVLGRMARAGFLDPAEAARLAALPLQVAGQGDLRVGLGGYYTNAVRGELMRRLGRETVSRGGLRVTTALDLPLQLEAERVLSEGLRELSRRFDYHRPLAQVIPQEIAIWRESLARAQGQKPHVAGRIVKGLVLDRRPESDEQPEHYIVDIGGLIACLPLSEEKQVTPLSAAVLSEPLYRRGALLRVALRVSLDESEDRCPTLNLEQSPQAALVVMETGSRRLLATVGGSDAINRPFDRAIQARRQSGSTFKPIVYAAALAGGVVNADSLFENRAISYRGARGQRWTPQNHGGRHDGRLVSLTEALARSLNVVAVQVLRKVGLEATISLAEELGLKGPFAHDLTLALGSGEASLLELTNAYATIAAGGITREPTFVTRAQGADGEELLDGDTGEASQVLAPEVAAELTRMLVAAVEEGTGRGARIDGVTVFGKTGTTDKSVDTWFVGGTRNLTVGLWLGFDDRQTLPGTAATLAVPLWARFMRGALNLGRLERRASFGGREETRRPLLASESIHERNLEWELYF